MKPAYGVYRGIPVYSHEEGAGSRSHEKVVVWNQVCKQKDESMRARFFSCETTTDNYLVSTAFNKGLHQSVFSDFICVSNGFV